MNSIEYIPQILADVDVESTNPMDILNKKIGIEVGADSVYALLDMGGMYSVFLSILILLGGITILGSLSAMLFVSKKETRAEMKRGVLTKCAILFLAASAITVMNIYLLIGQALQAA